MNLITIHNLKIISSCLPTKINLISISM